jgi:hypothetical protein
MRDCSGVVRGDDSRGGWDFFVSYTQANRGWAEWVAWILEEDGHRVLIQAWDFVAGSNWTQGMQAGTRDATRTRPPSGPDHPAVAADLSNLAMILRDLRQPEEARPLQERALAIYEAVRIARSGLPGGQAAD